MLIFSLFQFLCVTMAAATVEIIGGLSTDISEQGKKEISQKTLNNFLDQPVVLIYLPDANKSSVAKFVEGRQSLGVFSVSTMSGKQYVIKFESLEDLDNRGQMLRGCYRFNERSFALLAEKKRPDLFVLPEVVFIDPGHNIAALLMHAAQGVCLGKILREVGYADGKRALLAYTNLLTETRRLGVCNGDTNLGSPIYNTKTGCVVYVDCGDWKSSAAVISGQEILCSLLRSGAIGSVNLRQTTDIQPILKLESFYCNVVDPSSDSWDGLNFLFTGDTGINAFILLEKFYFLIKETIDLLIKNDPSLSYEDCAHLFGKPLSQELLAPVSLNEEGGEAYTIFWQTARKQTGPDQLFNFAKESYLILRNSIPQKLMRTSANPIIYTVSSYHLLQLWICLHDKQREVTSNVSSGLEKGPELSSRTHVSS